METCTYDESCLLMTAPGSPSREEAETLVRRALAGRWVPAIVEVFPGAGESLILARRVLLADWLRAFLEDRD